ncbi:MAG: selenium metabolism-associated LysR family transcriptional regulator [Chloroflexota bacterium]
MNLELARAPSLAQIVAFCRVVELGTFTAAAADLHLSQPAISRQVQELERCYRVPLFEIVRRRPVLTDAGEYFYEWAQRVKHELLDADRAMAEYRAGRGGRISLGVTRTIGTYVLPQLLAQFKEAFPDIETSVLVANTDQAIEGLVSRQSGMALIEGEIRDKRVDATPFQHDRLLLVVPPSHPFAQRKEVTSDDVAKERFIGREVGSGTRALVEQVFPAPLHATLELASIEGMKRAVIAGLGISIISEAAVRDELARGELHAVPIRGIAFERLFLYVTLRKRVHSPPVQAFVAMLQLPQASK